MLTVALIGCGKTKLPTRAQALNLYTGGLFVASRDYALATHTEVFVLSARHGLVGLEEELDPYDFTMSDYPDVNARALWGRRVVADLAHRIGPPSKVTVLAGERYAKWLRGPMAAVRVWPEPTYPLAGLGIGRRLAWLKAGLADAGGKPC